MSYSDRYTQHVYDDVRQNAYRMLVDMGVDTLEAASEAESVAHRAATMYDRSGTLTAASDYIVDNRLTKHAYFIMYHTGATQWVVNEWEAQAHVSPSKGRYVCVDGLTRHFWNSIPR